MPRHARKYYNTSFFHVIVQGINKEYIFKEERYIKEYMKLLNKNKEHTSIQILSYCIMNNHAHLLIYTNTINEMSKFMKKVNASYAKYYNYMEQNRVGYVFRDRFLSEPIKDESHLIKCINYIHANPVNAGMVKYAKDYKYSSYKQYLKNNKLKQISKITGITIDMEMIINNNDIYGFKDIEKDNNIEEIIRKIFNVGIEELKSDTDKLKDTIKLLKENYGITYKEIKNKFELSRYQMDKMKE